MSISKGLAIDMRPRRFNVVSPGAIDIEMWEMETAVKEIFCRCSGEVIDGESGEGRRYS